MDRIRKTKLESLPQAKRMDISTFINKPCSPLVNCPALLLVTCLHGVIVTHLFQTYCLPLYGSALRSVSCPAL